MESNSYGNSQLEKGFRKLVMCQNGLSRQLSLEVLDSSEQPGLSGYSLVWFVFLWYGLLWFGMV